MNICLPNSALENNLILFLCIFLITFTTKNMYSNLDISCHQVYFLNLITLILIIIKLYIYNIFDNCTSAAVSQTSE